MNDEERKLANDKLRERGRAVSPEEKRELMEAILKEWLRFPSLRLGQLLVCSHPMNPDLFYVEDREILNNLKEFEKK